MLVCHAANTIINPVTHREVIFALDDFSERNPFDRKAFNLGIKLYTKPIFKLWWIVGDWKIKALNAASTTKFATKSFKNKAS